MEPCSADRELLDLVIKEIAALPVQLRAVIYLRDIRGLPPKEVCDVLAICDGAQRVHLHRARTQLSAALEPYLAVDRTRPGHNAHSTGA